MTQEFQIEKSFFFIPKIKYRKFISFQIPDLKITPTPETHLKQPTTIHVQPMYR